MDVSHTNANITKTEKLHFAAWLVVGLLGVVGCLNYLDRIMITTMRESIIHSIPMTDAQFGLLTAVFFVGVWFVKPFCGISCRSLQQKPCNYFESDRVVSGNLAYFTCHNLS